MASVRQRWTTLRDVAAAAGVSIGTASDALNNSPAVRPETRERVRAAAIRLNYTPNRNATRLLEGRSDCIGLAFSGLGPSITETAFYAVVVQGITQVIESRGYTMRFVRLDDANMLAAPHDGQRRPLTAQDVDGLLLLNWQDPVLIERLRSIGVPLVAVDTSGGHPTIFSVDNDDRGSVALGVEYLLRQGHQRIALLNAVLEIPFGREALAGYLQAFEQYGCVLEPWLMRTCRFSMASGHQIMADLLSGPHRPTAVFAVDDEMAIGAMQAIREAGLHIPSDISVVGRNDISLAAQVEPPLTTVRVEREVLGRRAAEILIDAIGGIYPEEKRVVFPSRLVERASVAALSNHYD